MLTTINNVRDIRDISSNLKDGRITPYIKEVEDAYILPAIGASLYKHLDTTAAASLTDDDKIVLDGGYYDDDASYCHGIRRAVAYFAFARVLKANNINVTAFGVVSKNGNMSNDADGDSVENAVAEARKMGELYLQSVVAFINRNECQRPHDRGGKMKFQIIG